MTELNILTDSELFTAEQIERIEKHYDAKYVCETCVRSSRGGWVNRSVAVFYQADPSRIPEGGSHWFGLFLHPDTSVFPEGAWKPYITNAVSATECDIAGIVADNGDVIYSRYCHDFRCSPDGSVMIDGGRDYTRTSTRPNGMVTLRIVKDKLVIVGDER
jgi:hypothetical protein